MTIKNYYKPTPRKWRQLGDALLGVSTFVSASAIATNHDYIAIISLVIGSVGKFLTNFFSDDK